MQKTIFLFLSFLLLTGCKNTSIGELNEINNKIIAYFSSEQAEYDNLSFNYIDEKEHKIIVGLKKNTKEEQEKFKKVVVDSYLIQFVEGKDYNNVQEILSVEDLKKLQEKITNRVSQNKEYTNFAAIEINEETRKVVVTLINNTEEEQKWFSENIVNSPYITFIKGGPYKTSK